MSYNPLVTEEEIIRFWKENDTVQAVRSQSQQQSKKPFYFLDGPPYTSGRVHVGTAWNKSLKDMFLRYKRMRGFRVWDRAGYDMHGLPTENATLKKLGIKTKEDVLAYGIDKFIKECRLLCLENLEEMNKDFTRIGVWMDFENAYQSITRDFMSGEWWLVKRAHEQGRLYEGLRTMTWCAHAESSLAKHELEYHTVVDESVFVKLALKDKKDEFLIIWTTTPWTIPFNLAVMAGPDISYAKVQVGKEVWYVAEALVGAFMGSVVDQEYEVLDTIKGVDLAGWEYTHPFYDELKKHFVNIKKESPKAFTVLLSADHVDTTAGSGLVHCAPGCGPEDYEVGHKNGIGPFNTIDEQGVFPEGMGLFSGLRARTDDKEFITLLEENGCLVATSPVEHDYPHDWRHHQPVIFRTTKQWFFKVEDMKDELIKENDEITWRPQAAYKAFDSWLKNLRDNSISKQRFWGCPLPVWRNKQDPQDYLVIGSVEELEALSGETVDDLHIPTVDKIVIKKEGNEYVRVPDVLDVWVDAGTTSWNCLDNDPELLKEYFPADFILEGKDQIRGWFNLLHLASMIAFGKPAFKACYMHGFINDAQGRKMSKSLGNQISPEEVISKYGADTMRYYMIGAANPGLDMNYNFDDVSLKNRNLNVYWNVHKLLVDMHKNGVMPRQHALGVEEKYMLSVYHRTVREVTNCFEEFRLNEAPLLIEQCLLELSRTYIQLVRDKSSLGSQEEKETVLSTALKVFSGCNTMLATITPFVCEKMYQELKVFGNNKESVHLEDWPGYEEELIDSSLEEQVRAAQDIISAVLAAREKASLGLRWPIKQIFVDTQEELPLLDMILSQTNAKEAERGKAPITYVVKPNFRAIGKAFGQETAQVAEAIMQHADSISAALVQGDEEVVAGSYKVHKSMLSTTVEATDGFVVVESGHGLVAINTQSSPALEAEGFMRELVRRVQQLRKDNGFERRDRIKLGVAGDKALLASISSHSEFMQEKVGASKLLFIEELPEFTITKEVVIKGKKFFIGFDKEK